MDGAFLCFCVCFLCWIGFILLGFALHVTEQSINGKSFLSFRLNSSVDLLYLPKNWYKNERLKPLVFKFYKFVLFRSIFLSLTLFFFILGIGIIFNSIINTLIIIYFMTSLNLLRLYMRKEFKWSFLSINDWGLTILLPMIYSTYLVKYYQYEIGGFYLKKYENTGQEEK